MRERHLYLGLWAAFLVVFPLYTNPSRTIQPADLLMVGLIGLIGVHRNFSLPAWPRSIVLALLGFVWYAFIITAYRASRFGEPVMMVYPVIYLYNFLLLVTALKLYERFGRQFLVVTVYGVGAAILLEVVVGGFNPFDISTLIRQEASFNNPNQLGYFALISAIVLFVLSRRTGLPALLQVGLQVASVLMVLFSQSKGAILGFGVLGIIALLRRNLPVLLVVMALVVGYTLVDPTASAVELVQHRFVELGRQQDDTWAGRGYDRIVNHPDYLFLGAAEGAFYRFQSWQRGELHSSLGTVLFAYGLPGILTFGAAILSLVWKIGLWLTLMLAPLFVYWLGHQGLRFPYFWVLVAVLLCEAHQRWSVAAAARAGARP